MRIRSRNLRLISVQDTILQKAVSIFQEEEPKVNLLRRQRRLELEKAVLATRRPRNSQASLRVLKKDLSTIVLRMLLKPM